MGIVSEVRALLGAAHVLTGSDTARYGIDTTGRYTAVPLAVVRPGSTAEVSEVMKLAHASNTPVVPVGGNTGLTGATHAPDMLMISLERLDRIREIRPASRLAIVEAGVVLEKLHEAAAEAGLRYPVTFGSRGSCQIGGNLATNAGGSNVLRFGNTRAQCLGLEVVLADGRIVDLMSELHKDNSGYDLRDLFIGSEGTLGIVTAAVLKLVPATRSHATAILGTDDLDAALTLLNEVQEASGGAVEAFEFMPRFYVDQYREMRGDAQLPPAADHEVTVLLELGSASARDAESNGLAEVLEEVLGRALESGLLRDAALAQNEAQRRAMWHLRESAADVILARRPIVDTDVAVPLDRVSTFLDMAGLRVSSIDPQAEVILVSHLGDGNLHYAIWPSREDTALQDELRAVIDDVAVSVRGSFSAEHGVGLTKLGSMERLKDEVALDVMRAVKKALDPENILNPGKLLP